jgi:ribosomal protein S18 acetylase RimI-like enzyme
LGEQVYGPFERWAHTLGAAEIRLSVAEQNAAAGRFWQRLGFLELERHPPEVFGAKESGFILISHRLARSSTSC